METLEEFYSRAVAWLYAMHNPDGSLACPKDQHHRVTQQIAAEAMAWGIETPTWVGLPPRTSW